jgi:hypothetical protein
MPPRVPAIRKLRSRGQAQIRRCGEPKLATQAFDGCVQVAGSVEIQARSRTVTGILSHGDSHRAAYEVLLDGTHDLAFDLRREQQVVRADLDVHAAVVERPYLHVDPAST